MTKKHAADLFPVMSGYNPNPTPTKRPVPYNDSIEAAEGEYERGHEDGVAAERERIRAQVEVWRDEAEAACIPSYAPDKRASGKLTAYQRVLDLLDGGDGP